MVNAEPNSQQLRKFFIKMMVAFAFLGFTMAATVWYVWTTSQNNRDALCAYRTDLENRVANGKQFLIDNPNGIPGIPAKTLQTTIDSQAKAAKSFSVINCSELKPREG